MNDAGKPTSTDDTAVARSGELGQILEEHASWLASAERKGMRADLSRARLDSLNLARADLSGAVLRGASLDGADLRGARLTHADLTDASLRGANLSGAELLLADFTGADLSHADLSGTTSVSDRELGHMHRGPKFRDAVLLGANLQSSFCAMSDFSGSQLAGAVLSRANLAGAQLADNDLSGAELAEADLTRANLQRSNLRGANIRAAVLVNADLSHTDLSEADVSAANLRGANLADAKVDGIRYDRHGSYRGIRVATCYGSSRFRRFAQDQDYIEEFREAYPITYRAWQLLTDCGRSLTRVVLWSSGMMVLFAFAYLALGEQAFTVSNDTVREWDFLFTALYSSVSNFVTLGFGDVLPLTPLAAVVVMSEVIVGYVTLGILVSILATKVARRS